MSNLTEWSPVTFAELKQVYVTGVSQVFLDVLVCETERYYFHFHGYIIRKTAEHRLLTPADLVDHVPLNNVLVKKSNGRLVNLVVMKYHICNTLWH